MKLIAYRLHPKPEMPIVPAIRYRDWMQDTPRRFANRCLPMLVANQSGWFILNSHKMRVVWTGSDDLDGVQIEAEDNEFLPAISHFGSGILTWHFPYLFRTDPGYNLIARGPPNWPKDGITALEGIVETDWSVATFTMNWKITRPYMPIPFEQGEPVCMIYPVRRGELEEADPQIRPIEDDLQLRDEYDQWAMLREEFNDNLSALAGRAPWQKHYYQGMTPSGHKHPEHQINLNLQNFKEHE